MVEQFEKIYLYQRIVRAKLFIDAHYADAIDLNNIADQACFSKFHFIRLFKSVYGKTPNNYLVQVRVERAKTLLTAGHTVLQTSLEVGFESSTSFAGCFKKYTGQSPSLFQKKALAKQHAVRLNPLQFVPNCFAETHGFTK